ncbi:L,D-transpeptidase Cds6 family protein [Thiosulfativibrio zosterae]|uniref:L,D-transpeptidase Cds6 family protein n=1 Tax=Thiosulfativibrio zosterae TaxID=2675053 RepID=UPI001563B2AD|nr:hypothetical protein [Thiosulfativibrio zosterae]
MSKEVADAMIASQTYRSNNACQKAELTFDFWRYAWMTKKVDLYLAQYAPDFASENMSHAAWKALRAERINAPKGYIWIGAENKTWSNNAKQYQVTFKQNYKSNLYQDTVIKTLVFEDIGGKCLITKELVISS